MNGVPLPPNWKFNLPQIMQAIGVLLMMLGWGYQSAAKDHPEEISALPDLTALAGVAVTVGGMLVHGINAKASQAAHESAEKSPPVDAEGNMTPRHTVAVAVRQATSAGDDDLAMALVKALSDNAQPASELPKVPKGGRQ